MVPRLKQPYTAMISNACYLRPLTTLPMFPFCNEVIEQEVPINKDEDEHHDESEHTEGTRRRSRIPERRGPLGSFRCDMVCATIVFEVKIAQTWTMWGTKFYPQRYGVFKVKIQSCVFAFSSGSNLRSKLRTMIFRPVALSKAWSCDHV